MKVTSSLEKTLSIPLEKTSDTPLVCANGIAHLPGHPDRYQINPLKFKNYIDYSLVELNFNIDSKKILYICIPKIQVVGKYQCKYKAKLFPTMPIA